jgi:hypothetical protein
MEELKLMVPTYNGKWLEGPNCSLDDFGPPEVPVLVRPADGVRIVLGTHDYDDYCKPEVQIERRHNGWAIFLQPLGGSDASGFVYFLDDGRSYVVKEHGYGTEQIQLVEYEEAVAEVDDILPTGPSCAPTMIIERLPVDKDQDFHRCELASNPSVPALEIVQHPISQSVMAALKAAQKGCNRLPPEKIRG